MSGKMVVQKWERETVEELTRLFLTREFQNELVKFDVGGRLYFLNRLRTFLLGLKERE